MSTIEERRAVATAGVDGAADGFATRIFLQPIAAPSILGLFGFAAATFIVAANVAGWYGNHSTTPLVLAPFAAVSAGSPSSWPECGRTARGTRWRRRCTACGARSGSPTGS